VIPFRRLHRHLDPGSTMGELIFGMIMVLTFTLGARLLGADEPTDGREIMIAAIGCNIAWGLIDAFLFLLGIVHERRRVAGLQAALRDSRTDAAVLPLLREELDEGLSRLAAREVQDGFYAAIAAGARRGAEVRVRLTSDDFRAAFLIFVLVVVTALPAAVPFLLLEDSYLALRASNGVMALLLFAVGYFWGKNVGAEPLVSGCLVMSIGVVLVLVAIPLGG
jgi:VIT1/CCC1 family predicted Fe2+/Mn2+ transporter